MEAEVKNTASIIDPKYRGRAKVADWLSTFVDGIVSKPTTKEKQVKTQDEDGNEVVTTETVELARRQLDLSALFALAQSNGINTAKMEEQRDRPNAPGRIRMTLGNSLRAAAKHRHGLFDLDGNWHDADAEFIGDSVKTQNPDGSKIVVAKPAAEADTEQTSEE